MTIRLGGPDEKDHLVISGFRVHSQHEASRVCQPSSIMAHRLLMCGSSMAMTYLNLHFGLMNTTSLTGTQSPPYRVLATWPFLADLSWAFSKKKHWDRQLEMSVGEERRQSYLWAK